MYGMRCKGIWYMFDIKKPVSSYRYATGQKPCITYANDTRYLGVVVVNTNVDKIDSKKVDKYLLKQ